MKKNILDAIFEKSIKDKCPDIHLGANRFPNFRTKSGDIESIENYGEIKFSLLSNDDLRFFIEELLGKKAFEKLENDMELDGSYEHNSGQRYRVNCYIDTQGYALAMRLIPSKIPSLQELGFGEQIEDLCKKSKGLILVTGPTGSGKSTNLAAIVDYINTHSSRHIITIEDPVEFAFKSKKSLIHQREVGSHTKSFPQAIRAALREDPDVIMIGEMRDPETIQAAITLAETGHLVLSTLHTNDSVQTVNRIVDIFPGAQQKQIRMQLAMSLIGVVSQRLIPRIDKV